MFKPQGGVIYNVFTRSIISMCTCVVGHVVMPCLVGRLESRAQVLRCQIPQDSRPFTATLCVFWKGTRRV